MSTQRTNQFWQLTTAGAYMQAIDQANSSDRLARGAPRLNKHWSAAWEEPARGVPVRHFLTRRAWGWTSDYVTARAILASVTLVIMLPPFLWWIV